MNDSLPGFADTVVIGGGTAGAAIAGELAAMYQGARTLRLADGPDEVHRILIAKDVLSRYQAGESWDFGN